jgi:hypothetical protein
LINSGWIKRNDPGELYLLNPNDAAGNDKDGLLLHHLGAAYGGIWREGQAGHLIDAALTLEFIGA